MTSSKEDRQTHKKLLSVCISSDVSTLDPRLGADATSTQVIKMLFEGLMHLNEDGIPSCALARSYDVSDDKKTYVFHLRDCQWSNGMDVTAYDIEYSWKSILELQSLERSMCIHNFFVIKNVCSFLKGSCVIEEVGIKAVDAKTFRVELESPVPYFLEALTNTWFFPVNKFADQHVSSWSKHVGRDFICSGPFRLIEHKRDQHLILKNNPLFWDASRVGLEEIHISVVKDAMTRLCLFEKGLIDWIGRPLSGMPLDACAILKKDDKLHFAPSLGIYWYFFNTDRFPFCNKKMRKAFYYAINRLDITDYVLQSKETPAFTVLSMLNDAVDQTLDYQSSLAMARELFEEALCELGIKKHNLPELTISYNSDEIHQNVAQIIQQQLFSAFGVKVRLYHSDWRIHYDNLRQGSFCIGGMMWHSWVRDPIYVLQIFRDKDDGINISRWENEKYKRLLDASDNEISSVRRAHLLTEAHNLLMDEMPVMPIYFLSNAYGKADNLEKFYILENSIIDFRYAYFSEQSSRKGLSASR